MTSRIQVSPQTKVGSLLIAFVTNLISARHHGRRVKAILDAASYGDPADWDAVAVELGITGPDAATKAQAVWSVVSTAMSEIDSSEVAELSRLDQG